MFFHGQNLRRDGHLGFLLRDSRQLALEVWKQIRKDQFARGDADFLGKGRIIVVLGNRHDGFVEHLAGIHRFHHFHQGHAGLGIPVDERTLNRGRSPEFRQQGPMQVDASVPGDIEHAFGDDLPISHGDDDIRFQFFQKSVIQPNTMWLEDGDSVFQSHFFRRWHLEFLAPSGDFVLVADEPNDGESRLNHATKDNGADLWGAHIYDSRLRDIRDDSFFHAAILSRARYFGIHTRWNGKEPSRKYSSTIPLIVVYFSL